MRQVTSRCALWALLALSVGSLSFAQTGAKRTADDDWQALAAKSASPSGSAVAQNGTAKPATKPDDSQIVAGLKQLAQEAKAFYTAYPGDTRAAQARKLEATALLKAARPTDGDRGQAAFQIGAAYRSDTKNAITDRFEVAALMERQQFSVQGNGKHLVTNAAQHEKAADKLRQEFGDIPEVHAFYLGVVNTADTESAFRVAQKIQQLPAPAYAKTEAQVTIDRHALIGRRLDQKFSDAAGQAFTLGESGQVTVVYLWTPSNASAAFKGLEKNKATIPANTRWIYVATNAPSTIVEATKKLAPFPGTHCSESPMGIGAISAVLKPRRLPFVYVFGRDGALVGYGPQADLPALLASAKK